MTIENPVVEYVGASFMKLSFPVRMNDWENIVAKKQFNFNPDLFESPLPPELPKEAALTIIGPKSSYQTNMENRQDFSVDDQQWQIVSCKINGIIYPSFFNSLNWNDVSGTSLDAAVGFVARKAVQYAPTGSFSAAMLEQVVKKIITGAGNGMPSDPSSLAALTGELIQELVVANAQQTISVQEQVENYLTEQGIPVDFSESSFYFTVGFKEANWDVEINLDPEENVLLAYSSIPLEAGKNGLTSILQAINDLNVAIGYGSYEYASSMKRLYFKNGLPVTAQVSTEMLNELLGHNFKHMAGIIAVIDQIVPQDA